MQRYPTREQRANTELYDQFIRQKIIDNIKIIDNCWIWQKSLSEDGYGHITYKHKCKTTHRLSYNLFKGDLNPNLTIDHLCRNRACCNPEHLEQVSMKENIHRGEGIWKIRANKTHCHNHHKFTKQNTHIRKNGTRECKKCCAIRHSRKSNNDKIKLEKRMADLQQ